MSFALASAGTSSRSFSLRLGSMMVVMPARRAARVFSFTDLPLLMKNFTPARWELLKRLKAAGPLTIFALAKALERDYKNVHTDVAQLTALGLIQKTEENLVRVIWQAVRAEFRLGA